MNLLFKLQVGIKKGYSLPQFYQHNNKFQKITVGMNHIHNCYFHETNQITHFCKRLNCTLPMCQKCLPIHIQQHGPPNQNEGVISFSQALDYAVNTLKNNLVSQSKSKVEYMNKVQESRTRIMRVIDEIFAKFRIKLDQQFSKAAEIQKRLMKIQKGSLKTLIYFYSDQDKQINFSLIEQIISKAEKMQKACRASIELQQKNYSLKVQQNVEKHSHNEYEVVNNKNTMNRQRGYSFDNLHSLNNRQNVNIKSSSNLKVQNVKTSYNFDVDKKLSSNKSMKVIHKDYSQVDGYNYKNKINQNTQVHQNLHTKFESEAQRQKQIERIRLRQQQRQKQKLRQKQRQLETERERQKQLQKERQRQRQKERQRETQRVRQKQRQRQRERERERQRQRERQKQKQKQRQRQREKERQREREKEKQRQRQINKACERQFLKIKQTTNLMQRSKQNSIRQFSQNYVYQNNNYIESGKHETRIYNINNQRQIIKMDQQAFRRPLQVSDLNIQTKVSAYKYQEYNNNNNNERKTIIYDNSLQVNKQVLAPEQIRRMLQKRIEERSRLISKNRTFTSKQSEQLKITSKSLNKTKEIITNNFVLESQGKWDTKDSIINQIYQ